MNLFINKDWSTLKKLMFTKAMAGDESLTEYTATGNPVAFETDVAKPLKGLTIPFSGVGGLTAYRTGVNLFSETLEQGGISGIDGTNVGNSTRVRTSGYIFLKAGTKYTLSAVGAGQATIYRYDANKTFVTGEGNYSFTNLPRTENIVDNDRYIRIVFRKSSSNENISPSDISSVQLQIGEVATPYSPYSGSTYPVSFPAEVGDNAEGELDAVTGILTVTSPTAGTYQLDPVPITTLVGANTLWTDTNGTNTIKYLKKG